MGNSVFLPIAENHTRNDGAFEDLLIPIGYVVVFYSKESEPLESLALRL